MSSPDNSLGLLGLLGIIGTSLVSTWAAFKYVLLGTYRLNGDVSKRLIDKIMKEARWSWVLSGEHVVEPKYPDVYEALVILGGTPFFFSRQERLMTAGWKGKEDVSFITFFRWNRKSIDKLLSDEGGSNVVPISAMSPSGHDRLGELITDPNSELFLDPGSYEDMEEEVRKVCSGEVKKTGLLLHGAPGNGKTQFVKYLAKKYSLPINVVYFSPDYGNYDIARMFSEIPRRCIVLLEDFDNYFAGRECAMKNDQVRFTFDSVINAIDGVHNDYKGVVFVMTANDIERIDDSLKARPSRFKYVREFGPPGDEVRMRILGNKTSAKKTKGMSLDQVFAAKL